MAEALTRQLLIRKLLTFALCFLLSLLVIEGIARYLVKLGDASTSHSREFDTKYSLAVMKDKAEKGRPLVLLLGNSYMMRGVYPELLEARMQASGTPVAVRNLAASGATPMMNQFLIEAAIKKGARPSMVIYAISPIILNKHYLQNDTGNPEEAFKHSFMGQCMAGHDHPYFCKAGHAFYVMRYQDFLRNELRDFFANVFSGGNRLKIRPDRFPLTEVSPKGWSPGYPVYAPEAFEQKFSIAHASKTQRSITERLMGNFAWDDAPLKNLQDYCRKENIPLVYLWLPEGPIWREYYRQYHISEDDFAQRMKALSQSHADAKISFISLHDLPLDTTNFYNPDHLNAVGAIASTDALARKLQASQYKTSLQPVVETP